MSNWLTEAVAREAAYDEGYEAGKLCAAQQILDDLEEVIKEKREGYRQTREKHKSIDYHESYSYWLGRGLTCGEILMLLTELKKKYGID